MKPIKMPRNNVTYATDQPEYRLLPGVRDARGTLVSCWSLSWKERLGMLFSGKFYIVIMTFNRPLQPILPTTDADEALGQLTQEEKR
jgi:hypothetical protein